MAELNRGRLTPVLTADTAFKRRRYFATFLHSHANKLSHTVLINHGEGIMFQNTLIEIHRKELGHIVTTVTKGQLRQVIGAKGEEIGFLRYLMCRKCGSWNLNHRADLIFHGVALLGKHLLNGVFNDIFLRHEFIHNAGEWNHDLRYGIHTLLLQF